MQELRDVSDSTACLAGRKETSIKWGHDQLRLFLPGFCGACESTRELALQQEKFRHKGTTFGWVVPGT